MAELRLKKKGKSDVQRHVPPLMMFITIRNIKNGFPPPRRRRIVVDLIFVVNHAKDLIFVGLRNGIILLLHITRPAILC